jgi:hypothetical protein
MAPRRKRNYQGPATEHGDAYEPPSGEVVDADFPPQEPAALNAAGTGAARPAQPPAGAERQFNFESRPVITEVIEDAKSGQVTTARYIDGYWAGVGVSLEFPTAEERPSDAVKEPLKETRQYGKREQKGMRWRRDLEPKQWHKPEGANPVATRLETEGRFADAVKKLREEKEGKERDGGIPR